MGNKLTIEQQFFVDRKRKSPFAPILVVVSLIAVGSGWYLSTIEALPQPVKKIVHKIEASLLIQEPEKKPEPKPEPKPKPKPKKVYDLSEPVQLKAKKDVEVKEPEEKPKKVRKVYGVQKVYSKGLGSGGSMSDAVVGKVGNTVNKDFDTLTATESDLKGEVVSAVTVTAAPKFKKRVKAEITDEIRKSGVSGVIKVKVLVDIDGKVKKAIAQNDLGFGTKESALVACLAMEFQPAMRGDEAVAVWITIPVRFSKIS